MPSTNPDSPREHPAQAHLQLTLSVARYQALREKYTSHGSFDSGRAGDDYWTQLPHYVTARCPLCGRARIEALDTHSLSNYWITSADKFLAVYSEREVIVRGCDHFVAVQTFVNLNGYLPDELPSFSGTLDTPFVMPVFLPDDQPALAVMHGLPICMIAANQFVPRYAAYFITYYAAQPGVLWDRRRADPEETQRAAKDSEYRGGVLSTVYEAQRHPTWFDLRYWVERQKLLWLDPREPDPPLRNGPPADLPYHAINGFRKPFHYSRGKLILGP